MERIKIKDQKFPNVKGQNENNSKLYRLKVYFSQHLSYANKKQSNSRFTLPKLETRNYAIFFDK